MKRIVNYITVIILFFSCEKEIRESDDVIASERSIAIETKGVLISPDSISPPAIQKAEQPIKLNVKETKHFPYEDNVVALKQPSIHLLPAEAIVSKKLSAPDIATAHGRTVVCNLSEPVQTLPMRFRDNATHNIKYLDIQQGLPTSYIRRLFEDKKKNIWLSSNNYLLRFNGRTFVNFTEKNEILLGSSAKLKEDKDGNLWIANGNGLIKYNGVYFTVYDTLGGLPYQGVRSIDIDTEGIIWFTTKLGLSSFDGKVFKTFSYKQGFVHGNLNHVVCDSTNLWCGSSDSGFYFVEKDRYFNINTRHGLNSNEVRSVAPDRKGNVWITNQVGANYFKWHSLENFGTDQGLIGNNVRNVMLDRAGNVWFSAYRGGMSKFDGKYFTWYTSKEGLSIPTVDCFIEDNDGNIWAGTDGGGLCKLMPNSFKHFSPERNFDKAVMSIIEDKDHRTWLGTYDNGIYIYSGSSITCVDDEKNSLTNIIAMMPDSKGNVWIVPASGGVIKFDGKAYYNYRKEQGLFSKEIIGLFEDKQGNIWICSNNEGVFKFNGNQFEQYKRKQGLNSDNVTSVAQDKEGNYWFSTTNGINKFEGKNVYSFTNASGLAHNMCRNIKIDSKNHVWISTLGGGLNRYDGKQMITINKSVGLSDNFIRSFIEDQPSNNKSNTCGFWTSTDFGINHIIIKNDAHNTNDLQIINYYGSDGLKGEDFCSNSGLMDSKGRAWWGSVKALTTLQTTDLPKDLYIPDAQLDYIVLEQNFVDFNALSDSVKNNKSWIVGEKNKTNLTRIRFKNVPAFSNYPLGLELPHDINNITFHFSAINWAFGHKTQYQYFLEGADKEWRPVTSDNRAIYTDLKYGKYTFKVKANGVLGAWGKSFEYTFVITPPWWKTLWAYLAYIFFGFTLVLLYFNWRTKELRRRQKELEQTVEERTADVVAEKNKVEEKNLIIEEKQKEIYDSLQYAKQIQKLLLANHKLVNETLPDSFVMFRPRDIVSGDFYWAAKKEDRFYLAVCDSTGHGVPGAFMSLLNINFLNEAVIEKNIAPPNEIFNYVRKRLIDNISQQGRQDGMDGILICVNESTGNITYAAANNSPVIISNNNITVTDTDKMPIGKGEKNEPFKLFSLQLKKGDMILLYTDGYADQFGGPKGKKFKYKPLNELLLKNHELPVIEQEEKLYEEFEKWKGDLEQVDDVCILGIRL